MAYQRKNGYNMEIYIDQIEKFLKGQMNQKEEGVFKTSLTTNEHLHSLAFLVAYILRLKKLQ